MATGEAGDRTLLASAPRLPPGHVRRTRLTGLLDSCADSSLIVVRGPAGTGKTTLLADWVGLRAPTERYAWVTLDSSLTDPERFWLEVAHALLDGEDTPGPIGHARLASLLRRSGRPVTLVIDNAHLLPVVLVDEVTRFAQVLRNGRVVISSRSTACENATLAGIQAVSAIISASDLAYTVEEIEELLAAAPDSAAGDVGAAAVHGLTGGHALLTRLAVTSQVPPTATHVGRLAANWAVGLTRPDALEFACRIAQLPVVDARLAAAITDEPEPAEALAALVEDGLGDLDPAGFFSFHEAIGAALREHADSLLTEDARAQIRLQAADDVRQRPGELPAVVIQLLSGTGRLADLWPHFAAGFDDTITSEAELTLAALPPTMIAADGMAATVAAVIQSSRESTPSVGLLNLVDGGLAEIARRPAPADPHAAAFRELSTLALLWSARRIDEAVARPPLLLGLLRELEPERAQTALPAVYWGLLYTSVMRTLAGDLDGAIALLDDLEADRDPDRVARRATQRAFIHAMRGEIQIARRILETTPMGTLESPQWRARLAITRAATQLEAGDAAAARRTLRETEPDLPLVLEWPYAITVLSRSYIAADPVTGLEDVERLLRIHRARPITSVLRDIMGAAVADLALAAGAIPRAKELVAARREQDITMRISAARIALITADPTAISDLRRLTEREGLWSRNRAQALLLLAVHLHRQGSAAAAQDAMRKALAITRNQSVRLIQALAPRAELEEIAAGAGLELPGNVNEADPMHLPLSPVPLTARERVLLNHLATGASLRAIAGLEFVSPSTVKTQAASVYRKLGVNSRSQAVEAGRQRGLVDPD